MHGKFNCVIVNFDWTQYGIFNENSLDYVQNMEDSFKVHHALEGSGRYQSRREGMWNGIVNM